MLMYSMSVSLDGYIADRNGGIDWTPPPTEEVFAFHLARVRQIGAHLCGRRLYETMLPWETDPGLQGSADEAEFATVWSALPKIVFSRTLTRVVGNARLAGPSLGDEIAAVLDSTDRDVEIGGAGLAGAAIELGLVDELRIFRLPVIVGGGTPYLPALTERVDLELLEVRALDPRVVYERYRIGANG